LVVSPWKAFAVCPPSNYFSIKTVQLRLFVGLFTVLNYALTGVALLMELKKILPFWSTAQTLIASDFSERTFLHVSFIISRGFARPKVKYPRCSPDAP
jgi:hypothetical protein